MPRFYQEPEYRRRIREKAEKNYQKAADADRTAQETTDRREIVAALQSLKEQQHTYTDQQETAEQNQAGRDWRQFLVDLIGVVGLWAAAAVGVAAIWYGTRDADRQVHATRESFEAVQRAYITVPDISRKDSVSDTYISWQYEPIIVNVGNTQTKNLTIVELGPSNVPRLGASLSMNPLHETIDPEVRRSICIADKLNIPPDPSVLFQFNVIKKFHMIVSPKQAARLPDVDLRVINSTGAKYDKANSAILYNGSPNFFFVGAITYNDVFPNTPEHVTKYCFRAAGNGAGGDKIAGGPIIDLCSHWNCADDECADDRNRYDQEATKVADQCK